MSEQKTDEKSAENTRVVMMPKMRFKYKLLLMISSLLMMAFLRTGFVFFIIGMLPAVVAYYLDRNPHRYKFRTIFACNLSGILPFMGKMIEYGPSSGTLQEIMSSPGTWAIIYGAAGMGLLLTNITPLIAHALINGMHQTQINRLQRAQKKIEQEWGREVTQFGTESEAEA